MVDIGGLGGSLGGFGKYIPSSMLQGLQNGKLQVNKEDLQQWGRVGMVSLMGAGFSYLMKRFFDFNKYDVVKQLQFEQENFAMDTMLCHYFVEFQKFSKADPDLFGQLIHNVDQLLQIDKVLITNASPPKDTDIMTCRALLQVCCKYINAMRNTIRRQLGYEYYMLATHYAKLIEKQLNVHYQNVYMICSNYFDPVKWMNRVEAELQEAVKREQEMKQRRLRLKEKRRQERREATFLA